jgi:hypothetical protein
MTKSKYGNATSRFSGKANKGTADFQQLKQQAIQRE